MECNGHFLRRFDKCTVRVSYYTKVKFTYFADCITPFQNREQAQRLTLKNATNATSAARTTNYAHVIGLPLG